MKIKKVFIQAFRAYNHKNDGSFDFTNNDGSSSDFVAIYAPNGFGKSSFYDAVEWALTNNVDRFIRGHYKTLNQKEAVNAKYEKVPQLILRNNQASPETPTKVTILRDNDAIIENELPPIRTNSRDLKFDKRDNTPNSDGYRDIFLSQDAIDSFIRETKAEDRYKVFMDHFDVEADETRKKLFLLKHENLSKIENLKEQIKVVSSEINETHDPQLFEQYNITANLLSDLSSDLTIDVESFDVNSHLKITSVLAELSSVLTTRYEQTTANLSLIEGATTKLPEILSASELASSSTNEIVKLENGLEEAKKYQTEFASYNLINQESLKLIEESNIHASLSHYLAVFNETRNNITSEQNKAAKGSKDLAIELATLKSHEQEHESKKNILREKEGYLNSWIAYKPQIPGYFSNITNYQNTLKTLKQSLILHEKKLSADEQHLALINNQIQVLSSIQIDPTTIVASTSGVINISEDMLFKLSSLNTTKQKISVDIQENESTKDSLLKQKNTIQELSNLGAKYARDNMASHCPLCAADHGSNEQLLASIASNAALDTAFKALQQQSYVLELDLSSTKNEINNLLRSFQLTINKSISEKQSELSELKASFSQTTFDANQIKSQISEYSSRLDNTLSATLSMSFDSLETHTDEQIRNLSTQCQALRSEINTKEQIAIHQKTITDNLALSIAQAKTRETSLQQNPDFDKFSTYLTEKRIDEHNNLTQAFAEYGEKLSTELAELESRRSTLTISLNAIKEKLMTAGLWISIDEFQSKLNASHGQYSRSWEVITSFKTSLSHIIDIDLTQPLTELTSQLAEVHHKARLTQEVHDSNLRNCSLLNQKLELLLPYIDNTSLKNKITELQENLINQQSVDHEITSELVKVIDYLKSKISGFFYTSLINTIYRKIDPHPTFKNVQFQTTFELDQQPKLHILVTDERGEIIPPTLYFSAAQLNILSLSIFLARAIHAKNGQESLDLILIDDPIHSMDSINVLATIDLLRNISNQYGKQIIISTHNENFFNLLQKKVPSHIFSSKFLTLESYGVLKRP